MNGLALIAASIASLLVACGTRGAPQEPDRQAQYVCAVRIDCPGRVGDTRLLTVTLPVMANTEPDGNDLVLQRELGSIVGRTVSCANGSEADSLIRCQPLRTRFRASEYLSALGDAPDAGESR